MTLTTICFQYDTVRFELYPDKLTITELLQNTVTAAKILSKKAENPS